jgi:hypothetical protein
VPGLQDPRSAVLSSDLALELRPFSTSTTCRPTCRPAPPNSYHVDLEFRVPLAFAYAWCTDYAEEDPTYANEDRTIRLQRRILERTRKRVVFENLYDEGRGWAWERHVVTLHPPDRWHCDGRGSYADVHLDYRLTSLPGGRTRFDMDWSSSPTELSHAPRPSRRAVEDWVRQLWRRRARAMQREYRASRAAK